MKVQLDEQSRGLEAYLTNNKAQMGVQRHWVAPEFRGPTSQKFVFVFFGQKVVRVTIVGRVSGPRGFCQQPPKPAEQHHKVDSLCGRTPCAFRPLATPSPKTLEKTHVFRRPNLNERNHKPSECRPPTPTASTSPNISAKHA